MQYLLYTFFEIAFDLYFVLQLNLVVSKHFSTLAHTMHYSFSQEMAGGMESTNSLLERGAGRNKRKWTDYEDEKLVEALMELLNTGNFKADNGFEPGYLTFLEDSLQTKLPTAGIKGKPHIDS